MRLLHFLQKPSTFLREVFGSCSGKLSISSGSVRESFGKYPLLFGKRSAEAEHCLKPCRRMPGNIRAMPEMILPFFCCQSSSCLPSGSNDSPKILVQSVSFCRIKRQVAANFGKFRQKFQCLSVSPQVCAVPVHN